MHFLLLFVGNMHIAVHYGGQFHQIGCKDMYLGGQLKLIEDFDSDKFSWFELLYHLKEIGISVDFKVWQRLPEEGTVFVEISNDSTVMKMLSYLDVNTNIELYIQHLARG